MPKMVEQISLLDPGLWCGKTYQELSAATKDEISKPCLQKSSKSSARIVPMFLCLTMEYGPNRDAYTMKWADGALRGDYTMHSFGEYPREGNVSRLSQILEECAPQRFCLSEMACRGILARAKKRGKELPPELRKALEAQSAFKNEQENQGGQRNTDAKREDRGVIYT